MSVENTNTPNGDSDLYVRNEDLDKQQLAVVDMSEKNPTIDLTGNVPGDNTVTEEYRIINNTTAIRVYGSVSVVAVLVGQPVDYKDPDAQNTIKLSVADAKNLIAAKGAISYEDYIAKKAEIKVKEESEVDHDKNKDGIDDRNQ